MTRRDCFLSMAVALAAITAGWSRPDFSIYFDVHAGPPYWDHDGKGWMTHALGDKHHLVGGREVPEAEFIRQFQKWHGVDLTVGVRAA